MNKVRDIRFLKRMTQFRLAIISGVHQSRISLIENHWLTPKMDEKERLAKALGAEVWEIFPENGRDVHSDC